MDRFFFLPEMVKLTLSEFNLDNVFELRLRQGKPLLINVLGESKLVEYKNGYELTKKELFSTMMRLTEHSIYAYTDTIKQGYITTKKGIRVGICGDMVKDGDDVKIIKDVTSLSVRLPHDIKGCASLVCKNVFYDGIKNLLIVSPPGCGKTTYLRDIIRNLSNNYNKNVLVVDERLELGGQGSFDLGLRTDILSLATKYYGLEFGVKSMCPDVIAVDEISSTREIDGVVKASLSGVFVIATAHGVNVVDISKKRVFSPLFENRVFDYCLTLTNKGKILSLKKINYD